MAIKARIATPNGDIVIDMDYRNLSFDRKYDFSNNYTDSLSDAGTLYAISSQNGVMQTLDKDWVGSRHQPTGKFRFIGSGTIYEFKDKTVNRTPLGLNIKNSSGVMVFSSGMKMLRVVDSATGYVDDLGSPSVIYDKTLRAGRVYAVLITSSPFKYVVRGNGANAYCLGVQVKVVNNRVVVEYVNRDLGFRYPAFKHYDVNIPYNFQVIDVTGY